MRIAILLLLVLMLPAAFAIGLRIPPQFNNTVTIYTNQSTSVVIHIINDVEKKSSVTFFMNSPTSNLLINGVQNYSSTFAMVPNQEKLITIQLTGIKTAAVVSVDYGFTVGDNSSSGIGFQQVTKNTFNARVICVGICNAVGPGNNTTGTRGSGGGSGGGGIAPVKAPVLPGTVINDVTGDSGVDQSTVRPEVPIRGPNGAVPPVEPSKAANIVQSTTKGGESVALILMALLVFLMGFGTVT